MSVCRLDIDPCGPIEAGRTGWWTLTLRFLDTLDAGASVRLRFPLGWTPPVLEGEGRTVAWSVVGRALVLGEVVRRRYLQLNVTGGRLSRGDAVIVRYGQPDGVRAQPWVTDIPPVFGVEVAQSAGLPFVPDASRALEVQPGPPGYLHVVLPSAALLRVPTPLRVRVLDQFGNLCASWADEAVLDDGRVLTIRGGRADDEVCLREPGVHRLGVVARRAGLRGRSNPCVAGSELRGPWWGDPHVHTDLSDGTGSAAFALAYGREVACVDFAAITDHDIEFHHAWFTAPCQRLTDAQWEVLAEILAHHRIPGRYAVLRAYEWTGRPYGDRCVYFASDDAPLHRYETGGAPTPADLWERLRRGRVSETVVVPHTSASAPMGTDWEEHAPDLERAVEVYSMHGASECPEGPAAMAHGVAGRYVRDALARGYRLGFVAGGDMHSAQPGNPILAAGPYRTLRSRAGLTAIFAERLEERALIEAIRRRATYATTGARLLLRFSLAARSGEGAGGPTVHITAHGTDILKEVTVVRNGREVFTVAPGEEDCTVAWTDTEAPPPGTYYYVRVVQADGHVAWASPVWIDGGSDVR